MGRRKMDKGAEESSNQPGSSKQLDKAISKEKSLRVQVMNKKNLLTKTASELNQLIKGYEQDFGPFVEMEGDTHTRVLPYSTISCDDWKPFEPLEKEVPKNHPGCKVCKNRNDKNFSYDMGLCGTCKTTKCTAQGRTISCTGLLQLLNKCPLDCNVGEVCDHCRISKMEEVLEGGSYSNYCSKISLKDKSPPPSAQPGGFGRLMDLRDINENYYTRPASGETGAIMTRVMNFAILDRRVMVNRLLRIKLNDPRINSIWGLETVTSKELHKLRLDVDGKGVVANIVHANSEMIDWSPSKPETAIDKFSSRQTADFLVTCQLNDDSRQSVKTDFLNLTIYPSFLRLTSLKEALEYRGTLFDWSETEKGEEEELKEIKDKWPYPTKTTGREQQILPSEDLTEAQSFIGVIYVYISNDGKVYPGKSSQKDLNPRLHKCNCTCEMCRHIAQNKMAVDKNPTTPVFTWYKTVLFYLKNEKTVTKPDPNKMDVDNEESMNKGVKTVDDNKEKDKSEEAEEEEKKKKMEPYEAIIQLLFRFASLNGMCLSDLSLPFTDLSKNLKQTWKVDPLNLPNIPLTLLCEKISSKSLTLEQYDTMKELSLVLFKRELDMYYEWEGDIPLRYSKP